MLPYVVDWLSLLARWLHLITGIAWIGASFYFVWLDNHLTPAKRPQDKRRGVTGDLWAVHGGGFYHNEKFLLGPQDEPLSDNLHWFKWEAYWTWISGMLLLGLVYWYGAGIYLIDPRVATLSVPAAIAISAASLVAGWLVYDGCCRVIRNDRVLGLAVFALFVLADWVLYQLFSARAAYLHVGAIFGTIMVANVLFVIIPGQKRMVEAIRAGREPNPVDGLRGKQRSVHNTYITLPVLFVMISTHYPMTYQHEHGWLVLVAIAVVGVLVREFFVQLHRGSGHPLLPVAVVVLVAVLAALLVPPVPGSTDAGVVTTADVRPVVDRHCGGCHASAPTDPVFTVAPAGIVFDTDAQLETLAERIYHRTVVTRDMPLGNATGMPDEQRDRIAAWYQQLAGRAVDADAGPPTGH